MSQRVFCTCPRKNNSPRRIKNMRRQIIITICTTSAERRMVLPQQDDTTFGERRIIFRRNFDGSGCRRVAGFVQPFLCRKSISWLSVAAVQGVSGFIEEKVNLGIFHFYFSSNFVSFWAKRKICFHTLLQPGTAVQPLVIQVVCCSWRSESYLMSYLEKRHF